MTLNWTHLQAAYDPDVETHWVACCQALGLDCPLEVFEELFFEHHDNADFAALYRAIDWSTVTWDAVELSGVALRRVAVDRGYQYAAADARRRH